jgi:hypothetical protein
VHFARSAAARNPARGPKALRDTELDFTCGKLAALCALPEIPDLPPKFPCPRTLAARGLQVFAVLAAVWPASHPARAWAQADSSSAVVAPSQRSADALELGFENVTSGEGRLAFENRRVRHTMEALALLERKRPGPFVAYERRFGLTAASIEVSGDPARPDFRVRYPSDRDYVRGPAGPRLHPTSRSLDLVVGPLFAYELGRITDPYQTRIEIEPRLRYHPWPGARLTASMVIPVQNDFVVTDLHPDIDRVRPGLLLMEQFAWVPGVALTSATAGVFADNRYGLSFGAARPLREGAVLIDGQIDFTGFLAFPEGGAIYSGIERVSGFAGVTWRAPWYDVSLTARAARFLYGDDGPEIIFRRTLGDVEMSLSYARSNVLNQKTLRVALPVPPLKRSTKHPIRAQLVERFPVSYRTDATPVAVNVGSVANREDFLRQLNRPALETNRARYDAAFRDVDPRQPRDVDWVSLTGTTGFINTPWAGVMRDGGIEAGYNHYSKKWAYDDRGLHVNQVYYTTVGILPHVEATFRFTRIPGRIGIFQDDEDNVLTTDTDHMASGRLMLLTPTRRRPGVAIGVEDVEGTRRFHSTYVVAGMPFEIMGVQSRVALGYAPHVFTATRHVLDGGFGAFEVSPWRAVAARIEHDSEKLNVGIGVDLGFGLRLRAAALKLETLSAGVGWFHKL